PRVATSASASKSCSASTASPRGPPTVISLPRTWMSSAGKASSTARRTSSPAPSSSTIETCSGTEMRCSTRADGAGPCIAGCVMSGGAPAEGFGAGEDVAVDVEHRLTCLGAGVEDEAELARGLLRGDDLGEGDEVGEQERVAARELRDVPVVLARHDEHVHGRLGVDVPRSEEHTSELQSRENLVCRLLL